MRARHLDVGAAEALDGWIPLRRPLGALGFGLNGWRADAGEEVIEDHTEPSEHQELYVVLRGRARFRSDDAELEAGPGEIVFYDDGDIRRGAVALQDGTVVLAVGGNAGAPYEPAAWEHWYLADAHMDRGEPEKAASVLAAGLAEHPDHAGILVHLAAAEVALGRLDEAMAHVRRAHEVDPDQVRRRAGYLSERLGPLRDRDGWPL